MEASAVEPGENLEAATKLILDDQEHAEIVFDQPGKKVNVLSRSVFEELRSHFSILKSKSDIIKTLLIRSAKPDMFLAGADISEIASMKSKDEALQVVESLQELFQELEDLPQVKMVAIDGPCMGGGMELALACDYRVCSKSNKTKIGLPEVQLGVLPGAGGTQRLPRLINLVDAITMITGGAPVVGRKAKKIGLVDDIMPKETMVEICRRKLRDGSYKKYGRKKTLQERLMALTPMRKLIFKKSRDTILKKTKGHYPAPLKALEVVEKTYGGDLKEGLVVEANGFVELAVSLISKNLIGIFFGSEELKKERGIDPMEAPEFKPQKLNRIGVIGAGIMGGGIAAVAAKRKIWCRIKDISEDSIRLALRTADSVFKRDLKKKKIDQTDYEQIKYHLSPSLEWTGFRQTPFVVEAVVENMNIKKQVLGELEDALPENAIIATNTSSLSIAEMSSELKNPSRIVGMHFFNPVPMMPLVEVVRADQSAPEAVAQTVALGKQMGKTVIVVKDRPGFLINRILMPFLIESGHLKQDGYSISQIDKAAVKFGMPMGPFRLLDEIGLDTAAKVADVIASAYPHMKVLPMIHEMVKKDFLGKKNGKGFYRYDSAGKPGGVRPEFESSPQNPGEATSQSIQDRLILPMVAEAVMALEEGIVSRVRDLDLGLIYGIGFPPFKGGLLKWVSDVGEREVVDRLNVVHNATKGRLVVPKALVQKAQSGQKYYAES